MDKKLQPPVLDDYRFLAEMRDARITDKAVTNPSPSGASALGNPKVSLVTIVRNGESTLRRTIESVLAQTYGNIEYIIVDGGSTDGTLHIVREYEERIACWISEHDYGISDAFNKGVALATGDIVGFINADDWLEPETVEAIVSQMGFTGEPAIVHGAIQYWSVTGREHVAAGDHNLLEIDMTVNHPTVFATAECYERFGLFRLDFRCAMDYEWLLRARAGGVRLSYLPKVLVNMQLGGVSDRTWRLALREVARAKALHFENRMIGYIYLLVQLAKGAGRRIFEKMGLHFAIRFYRSHLSLVKKTRSLDNNEAR
jgi:glycosyltransferase involved in cell wall biosynthesis